MVAKSPLSTRQLMRLVVLAALNLALFQGVWMILLLPPITLLAVILNLTVYWTWVRRRRLSRPLLISMLVGLMMALASFLIMTAGPWSPTATILHGRAPGWASRLMPESLLGFSQAFFLDFVLIDGVGLGSMLCAGWIAAAAEESRNRKDDGSARRDT